MQRIPHEARWGVAVPCRRDFRTDDPLTPGRLIHTGMPEEIVTALDMARFLTPWSVEEIAARHRYYETHGLSWTVVESIPFSPDLLLGKKVDILLQVASETLRNLRKAWPRDEGIIVTINLMLGPDWMRTNMSKPVYPGIDQGPTCLSFSFEELANIDLCDPNFQPLPGWPRFDPSEMRRVIQEARKLTREQVWQNAERALAHLAAVAAEEGILLSVHADDPPFEVIQGVPRLLVDYDDYERLLNVQGSALGLCACVGSWASGETLEPVKMVERWGEERIWWYHIRQVKKFYREEVFAGFDECFHWDPGGDINMPELIGLISDFGRAVRIRADHGPITLSEDGLQGFKPGYTYSSLTAGLAYLLGLFEASA